MKNVTRFSIYVVLLTAFVTGCSRDNTSRAVGVSAAQNQQEQIQAIQNNPNIPPDKKAGIIQRIQQLPASKPAVKP